MISIIIPVYNQEKYIRCCLDSILGESDERIEVICVDDGSVDGSIEILKEYESKYGITVLRQENSGVSSARNLGLENASGKFVWFVDSDDFIMKGCLHQLAQILSEKPIQVAEISWMNVMDTADWKDYPLQRIEYNYVEVIRSRNTVYGAIISRELIENFRIRFNEKLKYAEDTLFQYYVYLHTEVLTRAVVTTPIYFYRQNPASAMKSESEANKRRHTQDLIELARIYKREIESGSICSDTKLQNTRYRVCLATLGALTILPKCELEKKVVLEMLKREGLYPYPWIWWHIRTTNGIKAKIVEVIKLPFVWEWYYSIYYNIRRKNTRNR